jgi:hypothetical protein
MSASARLRIVGGRAAAAFAAVCGLLALLAPGAPAATVVNGNFEAGNLSGWTVVDVPNSEGGSWFAYSGTNPPFSSIPEFPRTVNAPPQGTFAAISDQGGPGRHILYQDVPLEPAATQTLSMYVYYTSNAPLATPSPDSLDWALFPNQQFRVEIVKPSAPVDSIDPADVLATVFKTSTGGPTVMPPALLTVDLTPFAGQTVRIRAIEVDNSGYLNGSVDAASIATVPSNAFTFGKLKLNKKKGTGELEVNVPNPGTLTALDAGSTAKSASASKKKKKKALIKKASVTAAAPGVAKLNIKPTGAGKKKLRKKGKLAFKVNVTFTPTGGTAATQTFKGKLKLKKKKSR